MHNEATVVKIYVSIYYAPVAQRIEQMNSNHLVGGSIPSGRTFYYYYYLCIRLTKLELSLYSEINSMLEKVVNYFLKNQVILALFLIVIGWFMLQIQAILASIFIAYILMAALLPVVEFLMKKGFPKIVAVLIAYISVMFIEPQY